jgi:hypothetical protein
VDDEDWFTTPTTEDFTQGFFSVDEVQDTEGIAVTRAGNKMSFANFIDKIGNEGENSSSNLVSSKR